MLMISKAFYFIELCFIGYEMEEWDAKCDLSEWVSNRPAARQIVHGAALPDVGRKQMSTSCCDVDLTVAKQKR